ncbi:MAG: Bug family tripartite tricarboxylate transporter substrate binding protein [Xanthobacteraceae bacterium]
MTGRPDYVSLRAALVAALSVFSILIAGVVATAQAQTYPSRPVTLLVPYAAGGGTDAIARFLAHGLEARIGQTVIIENKGGQGTALGGAAVARAAPDGYTLLMGTSSTLTFAPLIYKKVGYDPEKDFAPVALIAAVPFVLVVNPSLNVSTVKELIALAKTKPGELTYASGGIGALHHVYSEMFQSMTGTKLTHVPYRGGGPALQDVVAGHVPIMFADSGSIRELVAGGQLKALAVTTGTRVEMLPDVPTMIEAGLPEFEAVTWQCVVAPANTPEPIVTRLHNALSEFMATAEGRKFFVDLGYQPLKSTPEELRKRISSDLINWAPVIKASGAAEQ